MIKFLDVNTINIRFQATFQEAFQDFVTSERYILGDAVTNFEYQFADYCGSKHCIGTSNGLDALMLIFRAYMHLGRMKEGDEVIVPANTFIASILSVTNVGLVPVFVEPEEETFTIDPQRIASHITPKTKAIMAVHLYGRLADMKAVNEVARQHNLLVIEDAAQAHGAQTIDGTRAGNLGDAAGFSFYPSKNLGALGDGGAVTTNDENLAKAVRLLGNYGASSKYVNDVKGFNNRLDALQAIFLGIKLKNLDTDNERRRSIASRYVSEVINPKIALPKIAGNAHVFHVFVIRVDSREALQQYLKEKGIETLIHYPVAPHRQKALQEHAQLSLPITERIHEQVISIPISPVMTDDEVTLVISALNAY